VQLQRQLEEFRSTRQHRTKLPETLWQAAVELAREHGLHRVAHPLRLDYMVSFWQRCVLVNGGLFLNGEDTAHGGASDLQAPGDLGFAEAGAA
jgi:hypothetical protein